MFCFDETYPLTSEQVESFRQNGFLLLTDVFASEEVADIQKWTAEVKAWPERVGEHMPYEELRADGTTGLCRTENYAKYHSGFGNLFRGKRLGGVLSTLIGEPAILFKEKINYKEPGGSGGFDAHIDANAYTHAGAVNHHTFLMAVNDMTLDNGCLEVVPSSNKMRVPLAANKCIEPEWEAAQNWVPVPMPAGALLFFGSYLAHRSGPNSSPNPRAAIYATYNGSSEGDKHDSYYDHRRVAWPPTSERRSGIDYTEGALTYAFGSPMAGGKEAIAKRLEIQARVDDLFSLIKAQGDAGYIGEDISQLEHSLQAAEQAQDEGSDDATVIAALLHDIGQFIPHNQAIEMRHNGVSVGKLSHDKLGEDYLKSLGFPDKTCHLVGAHVVAKRYLTATVPGYYDMLSSASQHSLKFQGGPFDAQQVSEFEKDPLHEAKVSLRRWDDAAKRTDRRARELDTFRPMVEKLLSGGQVTAR